MPGGQSGSTLGASLLVLERSTGTSISGSVAAGFVVDGLDDFATDGGDGKDDSEVFKGKDGTNFGDDDLTSGLNRLSIEKGKNLDGLELACGVEITASETFSTSVGVGGGLERRLEAREPVGECRDGDGVMKPL